MGWTGENFPIHGMSFLLKVKQVDTFLVEVAIYNL